ncbi:hypothetical protein WN51_05505 [Melipona quadrifasciata]|uniref:Uncharacterized protein n=1 Tax=Melipona quadrifasciata TaxID=166423 RepID=A0A0M9AAQ8_9HYME|nr:hypothetical protein WN51_05505 [Melipona quadrifasciata]
MSKCVSEKICDALLIKEQHIFTRNEDQQLIAISNPQPTYIPSCDVKSDDSFKQCEMKVCASKSSVAACKTCGSHCTSHNDVVVFLCTIVVVTSTLSMASVTDVPKENYSTFWQRPVALKRLEKTASFYNPSLILCVATYCLNTFIWGAIELTYLAFSEHVFALFRIVSVTVSRRSKVLE